jgi:outer membrane protein TolC
MLFAFLCGLSAPVFAEGPEPITLARAVELARAHAPAVAVAFASESEAGAAARAAEASFHPEALLTTSPGYAQGLPGGAGGRLPSIFEVEVHQPLVDPARRAETLEAESRWSLERARLETAQQTTTRAAVGAFVRCWTDEARLVDSQRRLEAFRRLRARVEALRAEGRATPLEVERAALEEAQARQARLDRESDRALDQLELRLLIGWPAGAPLLLVGDPLSSLPEPGDGNDLEVARAQDPELRGLQAGAQSLEQAERWRRRWWVPAVNLAGEYSRLVHYPGYDDFYRSFRPDNWSVGLSVALPLWTGGRAGEAAARVQASREGIQARHRARDFELELAVRRSEAALARAGARASLARRAEGVAEEELRVARALEAEGRGAAGDLERREVAVADAHDEVARVEEELVLGRAQALSLRGELWPPPGATPPKPSRAPTRERVSLQGSPAPANRPSTPE